MDKLLSGKNRLVGQSIAYDVPITLDPVYYQGAQVYGKDGRMYYSDGTQWLGPLRTVTEEGFTGSRGFTGSQGDVGFIGSQGFAGNQGDQGFTGSIGFTGSQGDVGFIGSQGDVGFIGSQGLQGNFGGATFDYTFSSDTSASDPGVGKLKFDNLLLSSALTLYIDDQDDNGTDIQTFLRTIDDSTSTIKGHFRISNKADASDFAIFTISSITEQDGYFDVNCAYVSGSATGFDDLEDIIITFARTGDKGDTGFTGSQGEIGYIGSAGQDGTIGSDGFVGSQGEIGFTGSQGETGFTGSAGLDGAIGADGYIGSQGDIGYTGSQGDVGFIGSQGDLGYTGSIGFVGSQGDIGFTGSQGEIGFVGSQGEIGFVGSQGPAGGEGSLGFTGSIGFTGSEGIGFTGSQGDLGYTGSQGEIGYVGSQGAGFTGSRGDLGFTGSKGETGDDGTSVQIVGSVASSINLPNPYSGNIGDGYITEDTGDLWVWDGVQWNNVGQIRGFTGSKGDPGGYTGSAGSLGYTGSQGEIGFTGSAGESGVSGSDGYTGSIGYTGSQGIPGEAAAIGYTGSFGDLGYTGSAGTPPQEVINFWQEGQLSPRIGTIRWYAAFDLDVEEIKARLGTAADRDVIITIKKNNTSTKVITIPGNSVGPIVDTQPINMLEDDYLTVDITQAGAGQTGLDLYLQMIYRGTGT